MFKKAIGIALCIAGILSLACEAVAGDLMQWSPRTPAGGGNPGYLPSYLNQAAAVEYGPAALVNRDIVPRETHQENTLEYSNFGTRRIIYTDLNGDISSTADEVNDAQTVQKQTTVIYTTP
jgi:hypothetical protein